MYTLRLHNLQYQQLLRQSVSHWHYQCSIGRRVFDQKNFTVCHKGIYRLVEEPKATGIAFPQELNYHTSLLPSNHKLC